MTLLNYKARLTEVKNLLQVSAMKRYVGRFLLQTTNRATLNFLVIAY
jgi:hypothetical protein